MFNELKDYKQAVEFFQQGAIHGCPKSLNNLAICYESGKGVNIDIEQAFTLYKESSDKGYFPAKYSLAYLYMKKAMQTDSADNYR